MYYNHIFVSIPKVRSHWNRFSHGVIGIPKLMFSVVDLTNGRSGNRRSVVRWLGSNLPSFLFTKAPRICIFVPKFDEMDGLRFGTRMIMEEAYIKPALSQLEELNDSGMLIAYVRGSETDTESCGVAESIVETVSNIEASWGQTNLTMTFEPRLV